MSAPELWTKCPRWGTHLPCHICGAGVTRRTHRKVRVPFDKAVERMAGTALMDAGLGNTKYGDTHMVEQTRAKMARLLRAAVGEKP